MNESVVQEKVDVTNQIDTHEYDYKASSLYIKKKIKEEYDLKRGYTINVKQVVLAFAIEFVIIGCSLTSAWYFAKKNSNETPEDFVLALLGPICLAMVELTRIPLALSIRTSKSYLIKVIATVGVICAAGITAKSMISLGQQMYEPRRAEVIKTKNDLVNAISEKNNDEALIKQYDIKIASAQSSIDATQARINAQLDIIAKIGGTQCSNRSVVLEGQIVTNTNCFGNQQAKVAQDQAKIENKNLETEKQKKENIEKEKSAFINYNYKNSNTLVNKAQFTYREAVSKSQLHSLASILLGKDMMDLEDSDISFLLRFFVYIPAFLVAFASTLIAITAVHTVKPVPIDENKILLPDEAGEFLFGPLVRALIKELKSKGELFDDKAMEILKNEADKLNTNKPSHNEQQSS